MNKSIDKLQIIFLAAVFFLFVSQSVVIYADKNLKAQKKTENSYVENKEILLEDVYNKLKGIKNKKIINAEKLNNGWSVTLRVDLAEKQLMNEINQLENCFITNYTIMQNKDENYMELKVFFQN